MRTDASRSDVDRATAVERRSLRGPIAAWGLAVIVALFTLGLHSDSTDAARGVTDVHLVAPGATGVVGTPIDTSGYLAAAASLAHDDVRLEWPGASSIGETLVSDASITFNAPSQSITLQGTATVDGAVFSTMLILDWDAPDPTPVISLGLKGTWDMAALNPTWALDGGTFQIDGLVVLATGEQDLTKIPAASSFYGDRESVGPKIQVAGTIAMTSLFPGIGADAGITVDIGATIDPDIDALLGDEPFEPRDAGDVSFTGTVSASDLSIPSVPGLTAANFSLQIDLAGEDDEVGSGSPTTGEDFTAVATGEVTIDDARVSSGPVTFDLQVTRAGADTVISGGLKDGTTWSAPFGIDGLEVSDLRLDIDAPEGETPTLVITGSASIGGVGVTAEITANDELSVDLGIDPLTVDQLISFLSTLGATPGSVSSIAGEIGDTVIGPTSIHLETEEGVLRLAVSTGISFREKAATILVAGTTGPDGGFLAAVQLPSFTLGDLWPGAPAAAASIQMPDGGVVISSKALAKDDIGAGGIEDTFLSEMYCGAATAPADCAYDVPSGVSLAATTQLDTGIRQILRQLGPVANTPVRITGTLPVFGDTASMSLRIELPSIVPAAGSASSEWLRSAQLAIEMEVSSGDLSVTLTGALNTAMPDKTAPGGVDLVTFTADAELRLGTSGVGATLRASVGTWPTPFGVDWVDLNGFTLQLDVTLAPQPAVQIGLAASATLKSPCAVFGGTGCPPPSTFNVSFAIGVAAGAPVQVDFGMRIFADAITLRDVAAIAKRMGATNIDPASLPNASLRNVEFSFSTIDAPALCLERGLTVAANVYLDSPMASAGPGAVRDTKLCSDTSITPREGVASCQADPDCFAHLRIKVSKNGLEASAALGTIDLAPVTIRNTSLTLVLTPSAQEFTLAGDIKIEGFASAKGSMSITRTGFAFSLMVSDDQPTGNLFTVEGSAGFDAGEGGAFFTLKVFARLPGLDSAISGAQDVVDFLKTAFTGEPLETRYGLRCIELNVDLRSGQGDPISGRIDVKVHFSATNVASRYEQGRVWSIEWNFNRSVAANVAGLVTSLSGAGTADDEIGCGYAPNAVRFNVNGGVGIATQGSAVFGIPVTFNAAWVATDYSRYVVTLDLDDGKAQRVVDAKRYRPGAAIAIEGTATYVRGDDGYERRTAIAEVHLGTADGPVVSTISLPMLIGSSDVTDYSLADVQPVVEGGTVKLTATWTDPVPVAGPEKVLSRYSWTIVSSTVTTGQSEQRPATLGSTSTYPVGSRRSHTLDLPIPNPCTCAITIRHEVLYNSLIWLAGDTVTVPLDFVTPTISGLTIDNVSGDSLVANRTSNVVVTVSDPRTSRSAAGYTVLVNGVAQTTTSLGSNRWSAPLSTFFADSKTMPLSIQVSAKADPSWVRSDAVIRSVTFRPRNSSSATPELIVLTPGVKGSFTTSSTTLFPSTADDTLTPFTPTANTGACGAIWWSYSAVATGTIELRTDGSTVMTPRAGGDTRQEVAIKVYDQSNGNAVVATAAPDGNRNATNAPTTLRFDVTVGRTYLIAVEAADMPLNCAADLQRSGTVVLTVTPIGVPPAMDTNMWSFVQSDEDDGLLLTELTIGTINPDYRTELDYALATTFEGIPAMTPGFEACFDDPLEQTVWYRVPPNLVSGTPIDITAFADADVQLAVFRVTTNAQTVPIASSLIGCSEDGPLPIDDPSITAPPVVSYTPGPGGPTSFDVIMFDTHGRRSATIAPVITLHGATIVNPIPLTLGPSSTLYDNTRALQDSSISHVACSSRALSREMWFTWTAPTAAPVDIGSSLGNLDVALAAFPVDDDAVRASEIVACNDEPGGRPETMRLNPTAGQTYLILVSAPASETGAFDLDVTLRGDKGVNDVRNDTFPVRVKLDNRGATTEISPDAPACPEAPGEGASLWYSVTLPEDMDVDVDTIGSNFDTRLVVSNVAEEIGCNDDISPNVLTSRVRADDVAATGSAFGDLYVRVDGFNGDVGDVVLNVTTRGDDMGNAVPLAGVPATATVSNASATVEPDERRGECAYQGDALAHSVWFTWTAPTDRWYTATAEGFDTQVTVFRSDHGSPGEIVGCGEDDVNTVEASARFAASAGTTFFVQVDGYLDDSGTVTMTIADGGAFDGDGDSVGDDVDNCVSEANTDQIDADDDGIGDACDVIAAFVPVRGARLVDTRRNGVTVDGKFQRQGPLPADASRKVMIAGRGGVPAGAKAVVIDVLSTGSSRAGRITAYAGPASRTARCAVAPAAASVHANPRSTDATEVIVPLGTRGDICLFADEAMHAVIDVRGFVAANSAYVALKPVRLADTRPNGATVDGNYDRAGIRVANSTYTVRIAGRPGSGVPADASVAVLHVRAPGATAKGVVTASACDAPRPDLATVVTSVSAIRSSEVVVPLSASGDVCLFTTVRTHLVVDVVGHLPAGTGYSVLSPARLADTRSGKTTVDGLYAGSGKVASGKVFEFQVSGRGNPGSKVPIGSAAAMLDIRVLSSTAGSLTLSSCGAVPRATSIPFAAGDDRVDEVFAMLSAEGRVCITTTGTTDLVIDVVGAD